MRLLFGGLLALSLLACSGGSGADAGAGGGAGGAGGGSSCDGAAKTPPNLVPNAGFECGDTGWSPQSGTLAADPDARSGTQAARLVATGASPSGRFATTAPIVGSTSGKIYCAVAWVKGTVADAQLSVLEDKGGGQIRYHNFSTPVASASWVRTPPSTNLEVRATAGSKLYLRLVMPAPKSNDTLLVDDVDLWESNDGQCKEPR